MSKDSSVRVLSVAFLLCLVCAVLVSTAAVALRDRQERNQEQEKKKNILQAAGLYRPELAVDEQFRMIVPRMVDLQTGAFRADLDARSFDSRSAARDPQLNRIIPTRLDLAQIKSRSRFKDVYLVMGDGELQQLILPVHGKGLWSTMYGFIALRADLSTINGFAFYQHGETPGLGGEVDNPNWKQQWPGKKAFDEQGELRIQVLKGPVDRSSAEAVYQVDGLAGATLTTRGVTQLLAYWLGEDGFRPFLTRLQKEGVKQ